MRTSWDEKSNGMAQRFILSTPVGLEENTALVPGYRLMPIAVLSTRSWMAVSTALNLPFCRYLTCMSPRRSTGWTGRFLIREICGRIRPNTTKPRENWQRCSSPILRNLRIRLKENPWSLPGHNYRNPPKVYVPTAKNKSYFHYYRL